MLLLPLLILLASLALVSATGDDEHMLQLSRARQGSIFADHSRTYRHLSDYPLLGTPDLAATAWEQAVADGVVYTATLTSQGGKPNVPYFFSVVHPGSALAQSMRTWHHPPQGQHKYAAVLWKWDARPHLVHVDLLPFEEALRWPLTDVHGVIRM